MFMKLEEAVLTDEASKITAISTNAGKYVIIRDNRFGWHHGLILGVNSNPPYYRFETLQDGRLDPINLSYSDLMQLLIIKK